MATTSPERWLKERINGLCLGKKVRKKDGTIGPVHCNTRDDIKSALNEGQWRKLDRWTNRRLGNHFNGTETWYFAGASLFETPETLAMIDIDCHGSGSLEGAKNCAEYLRDNYFPRLYFEPSTNGNGVHAYFVVNKLETNYVALNRLFRELQTWLRDVVSTRNFDIEGIEIKGTCPSLTWGQKRRQDEPLRLESITLGQLAKLPRDVSRFEEWKATYCGSFADIRAVMTRTVVEPSTTPVSTTQRRSSTTRVASPGSMFSLDLSAFERFDDIMALAGKLLAGELLAVSGRNRIVVTETDYAIFLGLLKTITEDMNDDGTLPQDRFKALWNVLIENGTIDRAFNRNRFVAIRDHLSGLGLIDWTDCRYRPGRKDQPGVAASWKASAELMAMMSEGVNNSSRIGGERGEAFLRTARNSPRTLPQRPIRDDGIGHPSDDDLAAVVATLEEWLDQQLPKSLTSPLAL